MQSDAAIAAVGATNRAQADQPACALGFLIEPEQRLLLETHACSLASVLGLASRLCMAAVLDEDRHGRSGPFIADAGEPPTAAVVRPYVVSRILRDRSDWALLALACFAASPDDESVANAWRRADAALDDVARELAVDELIDLLVEVDALLQAQAETDADHLIRVCRKPFLSHQQQRVHAAMRDAYRWDLVQRFEHPAFQRMLVALTTAAQRDRITRVLSMLPTAAPSSEDSPARLAVRSDGRPAQELPRVPAQVIFHEALDEVVAMVVARVHA